MTLPSESKNGEIENSYVFWNANEGKASEKCAMLYVNLFFQIHFSQRGSWKWNFDIFESSLDD